MKVSARLKAMWADPKKRLVLVALVALGVALVVNARRKMAAAAAGAPMTASQIAADPRSSAMMASGGTFYPEATYGAGSIGPGSLGGGPDFAVQDMIDWQVELASRLENLESSLGAPTSPIDMPPASPITPAPTPSAPTPNATKQKTGPGSVVLGLAITGWGANPYNPGSLAPFVSTKNGGTAVHPQWQPGGTNGPPKPAAPAPKPTTVKPVAATPAPRAPAPTMTLQQAAAAFNGPRTYKDAKGNVKRTAAWANFLKANGLG